MKQTTDYTMFKFRDDNRPVNRAHVEKLKASIKRHNMLHLKPISVNENLEIIDGQHRTVAAQELGVTLYYDIEKGLSGEQMMLMQTSKNWGFQDVFHYYVKNHSPEYLKLEEFMKKNNLALSVALRLVQGTSHDPRLDFMEGRFKFALNIAEENLDRCHRTIGAIEKVLGFKNWLKSAKSWAALMMIFDHPYFDEQKWFKNLEQLITKVGQRVSTKDYFEMYKEIHNFRNQNRIEEMEL